MSETCVIASQRPWNLQLALRLERRLERPFMLVTRPEDLTAVRLTAMNVRYVFLPHWSSRIPEDVWSQYECIVFHMTDLPYGRGGSPLQNLIACGHHSTMVSAIRCVAEFDAGPVYLKRPLSLGGTAEEIFIKADAIVEEMIVEILGQQLQPVAQQGEPTLFKRRRPEQSDLSDANSLAAWFDRIRMMDADGYPKAYLQIGRFRLEFTRGSRKVGEVVADVRITESDDGKEA
jgi:methionyl-tRNA formyltransferase